MRRRKGIRQTKHEERKPKRDKDEDEQDEEEKPNKKGMTRTRGKRADEDIIHSRE